MADGASVTVQVHFRDVEPDDRLRESIEKRCAHLGDEFQEVSRFEITIAGDGAGFTVNGQARGKNTEASTHANASDPGPACDQVLDKIERQLRKYHDKRIFAQRREAQRDPPKRNPGR